MDKAAISKVMKTKYCIKWDTQTNSLMQGLCSLIEHQSLVDVAVCCGNNTLHAHKCVLAANSPLFKTEFERNSLIEQIIINGCNFQVMKSIIEIMYVGETIISEEYIKYFIALAKLLQMEWLKTLFADYPADEINLPPPQFLTKKPKYYSTSSNPILPNLYPKPLNMEPMHYNLNKCINFEAEKACLKEANASRLALANIQKEITIAPEAHSFIIEEGCNEATLENFITNPNYSDQPQNVVKTENLTAEKIKQILMDDMQDNVELMFKTNDGNFVSVTEEVLQNISKGGLQYQVVDENGEVGEVRELELFDKEKMNEKHSDIEMETAQAVAKLNTSELFFMSNKSDDFIAINETIIDASGGNSKEKNFSPDIFFADVPIEQKNTEEQDIIQLCQQRRRVSVTMIRYKGFLTTQICPACPTLMLQMRVCT